VTATLADTRQLESAVAQAFAPGGALACGDARYTMRAAQLVMAAAVARAIGMAAPLVVEAGTGVGKTFAYLVPTLLSGQRALISTATKSLQDQLFLRDLPRLRDVLQVPVSIALLKGRGSYLCLHRLGQARLSPAGHDRWTARTLARVERWASATTAGDLAEVDGLDERSPVIPLVTSTRENCLGTDCPEHRNCHVMKARRDAMAADVVVVNHHLFFADMALRDTGVAELLPSVAIAVFDEAQQLTDAGMQFLATTLSTGQLAELARDVLAAGLQQARGLAAWDELAGSVERAARELRLVAVDDQASTPQNSLKLRWDGCAASASFTDRLAAIEAACGEAAQALEKFHELGPDFDRLAERARAAAALAAQFATDVPAAAVRWIDVSSHQVRLVQSPLDIRDALRERIRAQPKAWIFTSATLGDDDRLSWFTGAAGLEDATIVRVGSPFDYARQARLYVPKDFPQPAQPTHSRAVAELAARYASRLGGRTFVLTTTLRALPLIGEVLRDRVASDEIEVLLQGAAPKRVLMQRFLAARRAVLVGSQSFWEGIDVAGDALQCVVIDKLPFPPPNDPLVEARVRLLRSQGRNPFGEYFVAEAAVALKQGAGRLIRSERDRGLLVVCDPRLLVMPYGRRLCAALPPMTRLHCEEDTLAWLAELATDH
jgi:ATP-dependent DNA helicase DinG